jgi:hypothetical protein
VLPGWDAMTCFLFKKVWMPLKSGVVIGATVRFFWTQLIGHRLTITMRVTLWPIIWSCKRGHQLPCEVALSASG